MTKTTYNEADRAELYAQYLRGKACELHYTTETTPAWKLAWANISRDRFFSDLVNIRLAKSPEELRVEANLRLKEEHDLAPFLVQFRNHDTGSGVVGPWVDDSSPYWDWPHLEYRRKPIPTLTPWTVSNCPVGTVLTHKRTGLRAVIVSCDEAGFRWGLSCYCYRDALDAFENAGVPGGEA